ncbi:NUDIX hydrolase [Clostridium oceanicum]|uniref:NUDIX hydrolase n=1 Tax=Clostridium oceanicum TaxID=1543 RepID=A0ABP3UW11_9CLOT
MDFFEKTLEEKDIYKGKIIDVKVQKVKLPNGKESKREIVRHQGGVAVIAYKNEKEIFMVKQFRKPIDMEILEIPAGKIEKGEDKKICAERELEEEIGYKAKKWTYMGKVVTSPGFCDEYIYLYKAENLYKGEDGLNDEDEFIDIIEVKVDEIRELIKKGKIIDAKSICAMAMEKIY